MILIISKLVINAYAIMLSVAVSIAGDEEDIIVVDAQGIEA